MSDCFPETVKEQYNLTIGFISALITTVFQSKILLMLSLKDSIDEIVSSVNK